MAKTFSWELYNKMPVFGILRNISEDDFRQILPIYKEVGMTNLEVTMNTPNAPSMIREGLEKYGEYLNVGAGTVCNKEDLDKALEAGAQYIIMPITNEEVIKSCVEAKIPVMPGAYTPTEIYKAWDLGATMVKVFPATQLGAKYVKEVNAPLNQIKLVPTGGVNLDNFVTFLENGAGGLGIGSQLFDNKLIQEKDWEGLRQHLAKFVNKYHAFLEGKH